MKALLVLALIAGVARAGVEDDLRDGDRYFEDGDWARAAAAFDRAIAKAPGTVTAEAYGKRAAIFIILRTYRPGLDFIAKAKTRHPGAAEIMEQEALMLWELDKRDDAIAVAEKVVVTRPQSFTNQKLIGEYFAARDPVKTANAYELYLAHRPPNLESGDVLPRIRLGFAYIANARSAIPDETKARELYGKARVQFEIIVSKHGKQPNAQPNADNGLCAAYTGLEQFDAAITVCERVTADPRRVDAAASAWFNLATAYAKRRNAKQARVAAGEFVKLRKTEARGFRLLGDIAYDNREWTVALDQYARAEKLARPEQTREKALISIGLGKTYRRLPQPNIALAIDKLAAASTADPGNIELAVELAGAYLESKQDAKVIALADGLLNGQALANASAATRANVLVVAGKARFNTRELDKAKQRFEAAQQLQPQDVGIRRALVLVISEQAFEEEKKGGNARTLIDQALALDPTSPIALTNAAVLAISRADCDSARTHLTKLENVRGHDPVIRLRLLARSLTCGSKPDLAKAREVYAAADKQARKSSTPLIVAEIATEWAPLIAETDPDDAVARLEAALKVAAKDVAIGSAAKRNLALALYRRGWKRLRDNKASDAAADFQRALAEPTLLRGTEQPALELSYALALLDANRPADAAKQLRTLAARGNQAAYLKPAFAKMPQLFSAYASYRTGTLASRLQAASEFGKLEATVDAALADKLRELLASTWEAIAYDQWRAGQIAAAKASIAKAERYASGELKRRLALDKIALTLSKGDVRALEALGNNPAEALVNLGIVYEMLGRPKDALDAWQRARGRVPGSARDLQRWIDAKKRIHGL